MKTLYTSWDFLLNFSFGKCLISMHDFPSAQTNQVQDKSNSGCLFMNLQHRNSFAATFISVEG